MIARSETGTVKVPSYHDGIGGLGESLCTAIGPMGCGDPSSDPPSCRLRVENEIPNSWLGSESCNDFDL